MRKKSIVLTAVTLIMVSLMACGEKAPSDNAADTSAIDPAESVSPSYISEEDAKKAALEDAKLKDDDVVFNRVKLDSEDGRAVYEINFLYRDKEYDYEIAPETGEIIDFDQEIENRTGQNSDDDIGEKKAKEIILEKLPGINESDIVIRQSVNDGVLMYEGTVAYDDSKYEFEIDAVNGTIMEWEKE